MLEWNGLMEWFVFFLGGGGGGGGGGGFFFLCNFTLLNRAPVQGAWPSLTWPHPHPLKGGLVD